MIGRFMDRLRSIAANFAVRGSKTANARIRESLDYTIRELDKADQMIISLGNRLQRSREEQAHKEKQVKEAVANLHKHSRRGADISDVIVRAVDLYEVLVLVDEHKVD